MSAKQNPNDPQCALRSIQQPGSAPDAAKGEALEAAEKAREGGWQIGDEGDTLHGKIRLTLKDLTAKLFRQASEDPDSEANSMVQILLLNQIAEIDTERYRQDPKMVLSEERRRGIEHDRQAELAKHRNKKMEADTAKVRLEIERLKGQIKKLTQDLEAGEIKLEQARRVLDQANVSAEVGQPMDPQKVYRRIAEIVGLRAPADAEQQPGPQ